MQLQAYFGLEDLSSLENKNMRKSTAAVSFHDCCLKTGWPKKQ